MDITPPASAMTPFHRHRAAVVQKGASHTYRDALLCAVLWGEVPGAEGDTVTVIIRRSAWRAEFDPAPGAVITLPDAGSLHLRSAVAVGDSWHCRCVRNPRARQA